MPGRYGARTAAHPRPARPPGGSRTVGHGGPPGGDPRPPARTTGCAATTPATGPRQRESWSTMRDALTENGTTKPRRIVPSALLRRVRNSAPPVAVFVASGLLFVVCLMWAVMTPGTRAPDELQHLNSIIRLADGGGWPEPGDARVTSGVLESRDEAGATLDGVRTYVPGSVNWRPGGPM